MAKSSSTSNAKQRAAAARAQAEAAEKRRRRTINLVIGGVLVIIVLALIGGAWVTRQGEVESSNASDDAAVPTGVLGADSTYPWGVDVAGAAAGKPVLEIWEDFQCPACGQFEALFGPTILKLADDGDARVIWRNTTFLDNSFPGENSQRAAAAWGCAIDAGKKTEYHDKVFASQPATEGDGWTDDQLLQFGKDLGIDGEAYSQFEQCVTDEQYMQWAANGLPAMQDAGITGTPSLVLNGEELSDEDRQSPEALQKAIEEAGAPQ